MIFLCVGEWVNLPPQLHRRLRIYSLHLCLTFRTFQWSSKDSISFSVRNSTKSFAAFLNSITFLISTQFHFLRSSRWPRGLFTGSVLAGSVTRIASKNTSNRNSKSLQPPPEIQPQQFLLLLVFVWRSFLCSQLVRSQLIAISTTMLVALCIMLMRDYH